MEARMKNPAFVLPETMKGDPGHLQGACYQGGVPQPNSWSSSHLRASQINGCSACVHAGIRNAPEGRRDRRAAVRSWRPGVRAPFFTAAERAALELDRARHPAGRPVATPCRDELWDDGRRPLRREGSSPRIILMIAMTNFFNRINATIREPAGATWG